MESLPYYLLVGAAVGLVTILVFRGLRLAAEVLLFIGKAAIVVLLVAFVGWAVGWWELPWFGAVVMYGLQRLWQPLQRAFLSWLRSCLP